MAKKLENFEGKKFVIVTKDYQHAGDFFGQRFSVTSIHGVNNPLVVCQADKPISRWNSNTEFRIFLKDFEKDTVPEEIFDTPLYQALMEKES